MMDDVNRLYGKRWVKKIIKSKRKKWRFIQIPAQVFILYHHFNRPKKVLDIGASNGLHCRTFRDLGCYTFGIEGSEYFSPYLMLNTYDYMIVDIRNKFDLNQQFDLVHCVEVLEHIEEKFEDNVIYNILKHGNKNFIIAACSIGKPPYHINIKEKKYWIDKILNVSETYFPKKKLIYLSDDVKKLQKIFTEKRFPVSAKKFPQLLREEIMVFRYEC